jgi:hypothetical protein
LRGTTKKDYLVVGKFVGAVTELGAVRLLQQRREVTCAGELLSTCGGATEAEQTVNELL